MLLSKQHQGERNEAISIANLALILILILILILTSVLVDSPSPR
jgi:hypothetical protein